MSTTLSLIKPLNSRPASVMYLILWGHRNSTTTESQLKEETRIFMASRQVKHQSETWNSPWAVKETLNIKVKQVRHETSKWNAKRRSETWSINWVKHETSSEWDMEHQSGTFRIGTNTFPCQIVFRYRNPHLPLPNGFCQCLSDSARILPSESGFCQP